jgi:outer membrane protein assembly factor BamE (lipoprotein component of BamABCDE complex)
VLIKFVKGTGTVRYGGGWCPFLFWERESVGSKMRIIRVALILGLVILFAGLMTSCAPNYSCFPVPEMDDYKVDCYENITRGITSAAEVVKLLGEPPEKGSAYFYDDAWIYPSRICFSMRPFVRACLLNIEFDSNGVVTNWTFVNPYTNLPLPIRETLEEADKKLKHEQKYCDVPRIEIVQSVVKGVSTREDIEHVFSAWEPSSSFTVKKIETEQGEIWSYYVDRPSPLYIPPFHLIFTFDEFGRVELIVPQGYAVGPPAL